VTFIPILKVFKFVSQRSNLLIYSRRPQKILASIYIIFFLHISLTMLHTPEKKNNILTSHFEVLIPPRARNPLRSFFLCLCRILRLDFNSVTRKGFSCAFKQRKKCKNKHQTRAYFFFPV